jgi:FkbH-like protein
MSSYIFRNSTIEPFFQGAEYSFSQYYDINHIPENVNTFIWFYQVPFGTERKSLIEEIEQYYKNLVFVSNRISKNKLFLVFTLHDYLNFNFSSGDFELKNTIDDFNRKIIKLMEEHVNLKVIDFRDFTCKFESDELIDWKFYYNAQIYLNLKLINPFKTWFQSQLNAVLYKRKKCIIVDLDNTLWGGVLGEEGIHGIQIGNDYPGSAFLHFQKALIELVNNGVILALCSKNNEQDILDVWEQNPYNIINKKHISAYRINWNNKADNIREIIQELNIGADSVVFVDDNPTEREIIKHYLPDVEVPDFPEHPYLLPRFTKNLVESYFVNYRTTEEDLKKTEQYQMNAARAKAQESFSDISEYLESLEIEIKVEPINEFNIERIAQMTQKTNQFNLTTRRYDVSSIRSMHDSGALIYVASVKDKFGDNGITGLIIIESTGSENAKIDSYLLSCRILGKGIEDAFFLYTLQMLKERNIKKVESIFIPSSKNAQVANFYDKFGFELCKEEEGSKNYVFNLDEHQLEIKPYYKITTTSHA